MSNPQEFKKVEQVKVSLLGKIKRIYNPSKDLKCLANQIRSHFKELNNYQFEVSKDVGQAEFNLQWIQSADCQITVTDNNMLEEIYMQHSLSEDNKVPRFDVIINPYLNNISQLHRNSEIMNSMVLESENNNFYSSLPNEQSQLKESEVLHDDILDRDDQFGNDIASQESDEAESEGLSSDSSDEELEEQMLLQKLKHVIRLEVENEALSLFDDINKSPRVLSPPMYHKQEEEEEEEEKVIQSQVIDVSVSVSPTKLNQKSFPIISKLKNFFQKKLTNGEHYLQAKNIGLNDQYSEASPKVNCQFKWKVQNQTEYGWTQGMELVQVYSWPVTEVPNMRLNLVLQPNETKEIQVTVNIPEDISEPYQIVMFRLKNKDDRYIGEPMTAFIRVNRNQSVPIEQSFGKDTEDFTKYNLNDEQLLGMASLLVDEGYGSFDRCYNLIRCLKGDLKKARDVLSELIFHECQH